MSVLEISRVDRENQTYDLAALFPKLSGFTVASVALLPPRTGPSAATVWTSLTVASNSATVLFAGPDADSTGAVVVTGNADVWIKTTVGSQTDAGKAGTVRLQGGASVTAPGPLPQVLSVQGRTGAVVLSASDVGADAAGAATTAQANAIAAIPSMSTIAAAAELRAAFVRARDVDVRNYGTVDLTGATDSSTAVLAAIADAYTKGVGVAFPAGTIRIDSQIIPGHDATTPVPLGRALRLYGVGGDTAWDSVVSGGTILDLRYAGSGPKILLNATGRVEIDHLTIVDYGTSTNTFIQATNAQLVMHAARIRGNATTQDAIILGGTSVTKDASTTSAFGGYGGSIRDVHFDRVRRAIWAQVYANSFWVEGITAINSGAGDAVIVIDGNPAALGTGSPFVRDFVIRDVLLEATVCQYGIKVINGPSRCRIESVDCWDASGAFLADVYFDSISSGNWVLANGESFVVADNNGGNFVIYRDGRMYGVTPTFNKAVQSTVNSAGQLAASFLNQARGGIRVGNGAHSFGALEILNGANVVVGTWDQFGYLRPSTAADGTGPGITVCTGVPNNANGNNNDTCIRADGTAAGKNVLYHKEAGAWVPLVP